ncbi:hypothetical protein Q8F55_006357 [Vanrija albida]|uniref:Uncharacterized protein n=1 Tax=Vanrija albida TaxID=181172 RepID=A0ABR3PWY9_9TREE
MPTPVDQTSKLISAATDLRTAERKMATLMQQHEALKETVMELKTSVEDIKTHKASVAALNTVTNELATVTNILNQNRESIRVLMEGLIVTDNHALNAQKTGVQIVTALKDELKLKANTEDLTTIKDDIGAIRTEVQDLKSDLAPIKAQLTRIPVGLEDVVFLLQIRLLGAAEGSEEDHRELRGLCMRLGHSGLLQAIDELVRPPMGPLPPEHMAMLQEFL